MDNKKCNHCDKKVSSMQGVHTEIEGKQVFLCSFCWNKFVSEKMGLDFETIELKPITLRDCSGKPHKFHFFTHSVPTGLEIEAYEVIDGERKGYEFCVLAPHDCNQSNLILDLYEKIKRGLAKKYLEMDSGRKFFKNMRVVGKIAWDDNYGGEIPELYIDGERVTWTELGRMLMTFEGWQFKMDIIDPTDEVESLDVPKITKNFSPEAPLQYPPCEDELENDE